MKLIKENLLSIIHPRLPMAIATVFLYIGFQEGQSIDTNSLIRNYDRVVDCVSVLTNINNQLPENLFSNSIEDRN